MLFLDYFLFIGVCALGFSLGAWCERNLWQHKLSYYGDSNLSGGAAGAEMA